MPAPFADLAAREIRPGQFVTAYDAVYGRRHEFLTMADYHARGALMLDPAVVYVDGARAGGLDTLKLIPASEVRCIRLVKPIDTTGALGTRPRRSRQHATRPISPSGAVSRFSPAR